MKIPKRKKPRAHLPALSSASLAIFRAQLDAMPQVSRAAKEAVMQSMTVAANKDAETPRVVIDSLPQDERALIVPFEAGYSAIFNGVGARGRNALMMDLELDEMIEAEQDD